MKNLLNTQWLQLNSLLSDSLYEQHDSSIESIYDAKFHERNQPGSNFGTRGIPT